MMTKDLVEQIRIDVNCSGQSALSMLIHADGTLNRQGNGNLPPVKIAAIGMTDGSIFKKLMKSIDERVFEHANIYDHPDKSGEPITYTIVFLGQKPNVKVFEFRVGTQTKEVGELLPYFDQFIVNATALTNEWYDKAVKQQPEKSAEKPEKKPWWKFGS